MSTEKRGERSSGKRSKSVRKKPSPSAAGDLAGEATAKPEDGGKARPAASDEPAAKISLPAYGFASEVLKNKQAAPAPAAATGEADAAEEEAEDRGSKKLRGGRRGAAIPAEDRIFTFADGLESGSEEAAPAPVRLETWVSFSLAGETFALPVDPVHEVVRPSTITRVPHAPFPIRGVTNLRGRVVPVIDLRIRLELPEGEITRASRIVVVGSRGRRLGLLVDAVHQVVHIDLDRVQPPPDDVMTVQSDYISGVYHLGEELVLLLDVDRVLIIKEPDTPAPIPPPAAKGPGAGSEQPGRGAS